MQLFSKIMIYTNFSTIRYAAIYKKSFFETPCSMALKTFLIATKTQIVKLRNFGLRRLIAALDKAIHRLY